MTESEGKLRRENTRLIGKIRPNTLTIRTECDQGRMSLAGNDESETIRNKY